jgi:HEAT repeat protein
MIVPAPPMAVDFPSMRLLVPELPAPVALPDINLSLFERQAALVAIDRAQIRAAQEAAREATREARLAMENFRYAFDWPEQSFTLSGQHDANYTSGKDLLGRRQYEQAITRFDRVIAQKGDNVDGALYWKAYAQYKLGRADDALATIAQLRKDHAQSRYMSDAKALEADARKIAGRPVNPSDVDDDELKLLAISSMQHSDPERAIPLLEGVLNATNSLAVKRRALYVLALSPQPRAYQILLNYAKGGGNPDLQLEAIRYIAANRNKSANPQDLMAIYQSTQDTNVKLAIISALRSTGDRTALTTIMASGATPVALRSSALSGLAGILSPQDLWTLYEKETDKNLRMQMISAFGSLQAMDQLNRVIKTEKDPEVRRRAVRTLGNMKSDKTGAMLSDLYASEQDVETKKSIISALSAQNNAEGLVAIARKEPTLALKTEIVRRLSEMAPRSKVAADYLMEIIK